MIIVIIIIISSAVGLIGFLMENQVMFYVGGLFSFAGFIRYILLKTFEKDRISIAQIRQNGFFQRKKSSRVYRANNEDEMQTIVRQFKISNAISRAITYFAVFGLLYWFFQWQAYLWIGIVFGLWYLLEVPAKLFQARKQ